MENGEDDLEDISLANREDEEILKKGDLSRLTSCQRSVTEPYERAREFGKPQFADRRTIREMCSMVVFDKKLWAEGMHEIPPPRYGATITKVQPDEGRRTRSQGIVYKA